MSLMARKLRSCVVALVVMGASGVSAVAADGTQASPPWPTAETPAYPSSPYHGVTDGNGNIIPCRCRFGGRSFPLGQEVCMQTHLGVVLARCDLLQNNTTWVPTQTPCTISSAPLPPSRDRQARR